VGAQEKLDNNIRPYNNIGTSPGELDMLPGKGARSVVLRVVYCSETITLISPPERTTLGLVLIPPGGLVMNKQRSNWPE
jgi:hypothetical protein